MATKTFEPTVAWPVMMALNGLAVDSDPTVNEDGVITGSSPWADITAFGQGTLGGGRDSTLMLYILNAMNPANNPFGVYDEEDETYSPAVPTAPQADATATAADAYSAELGNTTFAGTAKTFADQYVAHASWDDNSLATAQVTRAAVREKAAAARSLGSMMTMNAGLAGMTSPVFHANHEAALGQNADFAAGVALNAKQQQGEQFLRRWSAACRLWEAQQRGIIATFVLSSDFLKTTVQAQNDVLQLQDSAMENFHRWNFELWGYLLKPMNALSGTPIQPRDMTKKERILAAVMNSASVALQTGASGGNPAAGLGIGAVSLAAQLWGMR